VWRHFIRDAYREDSARFRRNGALNQFRRLMAGLIEAEQRPNLG
jgi:hypothetical protein